MFLPIRDDNPHDITPFVTYGIIALNAAVFLWQITLPGQMGEVAVYRYGFIPGTLFADVEVNARVGRPADWMTIFTSMFMHGGWMHIIGNMLYLWIFGDNIEASLGRIRY